MLRVKSRKTLPCPLCGYRLKVNGSKKRGYYADEVKHILRIRRLRCTTCGKIHHELPDILIPYKRHSADTIEKIISGRVQEANVELSTGRRIKAWWEAIFVYLKNILNSLSVKYQVAYSADIAPRKIICAAVNTNLYPQTRSAFAPP